MEFHTNKRQKKEEEEESIIHKLVGTIYIQYKKIGMELQRNHMHYGV